MAARRSSAEAFHLAIIVGALMCFLGAGVNAAGIRNHELRAEAPRAVVAPEAAG
jgi:hypothetical protein